MEVIPAIDLRGGKCVRLAQGDYGRETVFSDDPVAVAARWAEAGAARIHVVDLDGARSGARANDAAIRALVHDAELPVQLGGGIRDAPTALDLLESGVQRVVFGTAAVEAPDEIAQTVRRAGAESVVVAIDARSGKVAIRGWLETSETTALELMAAMSEAGVRRFIYTDIARDGTLAHPNFAALADILEGADHPIIASGGVATIHDLRRLAGMGAEAAITGRAIYSGAIDLAEAIREVTETR